MKYDKYNAVKMRRCKKFIFCALFFCVFILLLIYREEYLKLRYIFEVGGLLKPPELPSNCLVINDSLVKNQEEYNVFARPRSQWTVVNNFHIYSAFIQKHDTSVSAVALGIGGNIQQCEKFKCHLWYTKGGLKFSLDGEFSCLSFGRGLHNSFLLELYCKVDSDSVNGVPYILVLIDETYGRHLIPLHSRKKRDSPEGHALCILPDYSGLEQISIVEFLTHHQLIGFTDIIAYDSMMHHGILNSLEHIFYDINYLKSFSVLPWNLPLGYIDSAKEIIMKDCFYRTEGNVLSVFLLNWNEYLIPNKNYSLLPIFSFSSKKTTFPIVSTRKCCINLRDNKNSDKSWPQIFRKTVCLRSLSNSSNIKPNDVSFQTVFLAPSELYMNEYALCEVPPKHIVEDHSVLKFLVNSMGNKLMGIWRSGTLFEK